MSYVKLPKARGDLGIGYQTWNQLRDNLEEVRDDYLVEHSNGDELTGPLRPIVLGGLDGGLPPVRQLGRHDTPRIARLVCNVGFTTALGGAGPPSITYASSSIVAGVEKWDTGVYMVLLAGLSSFRSTVQVLSSSASRQFATQSFNLLRSATLPNAGVLVYLYERSTGMDLVDGIPFSLTVYGVVG